MGKKIGKYELGKTLGTGAFSKVKLGTDCETGQQWAIKIIDKEQLQRERMEEQLKREIAIMKALKHENVVALQEVMQTQNHIYLVLELVSGGELFDKIVSQKRFDEDTARKYFRQLISGVHYCHQQGIAHRDIKPENLLLDDNGTLKISDFGLSNLQPSNKSGLLQTVCGTPNYVAPEVLKEKGYNGFLADAWSCGIVLFVMHAGYLPFDDQNMNALFNKIERGDYRMARHFSEGIQDIITRLLTVDPKKRLSIEGILQHPWFIAGGGPKIDAVAKKIDPTAADVSNAIQSTAEEHDTDSAKAASPLGPEGAAAAAGSPATDTVDAFQLISRLTQGALNPYTTSMQSDVSVVPKTSYMLVTGLASPVRDVVAVFQSCGCNTKVHNNEIKGFFNGAQGLLTFTAVPTLTTAGDLCLVEFKRGRGDMFEFQTLAKSVAAAFGPKMRSTIIDVPPPS